MKQKAFRAMFWACGPLACGAVFVLPFQFPGKVPQLSLSFAAGYSNRVAVMGLVLTAALACLCAFLSGWKEIEADAHPETHQFGRG